MKYLLVIPFLLFFIAKVSFAEISPSCRYDMDPYIVKSNSKGELLIFCSKEVIITTAELNSIANIETISGYISYDESERVNITDELIVYPNGYIYNYKDFDKKYNLHKTLSYRVKPYLGSSEEFLGMRSNTLYKYNIRTKEETTLIEFPSFAFDYTVTEDGIYWINVDFQIMKFSNGSQEFLGEFMYKDLLNQERLRIDNHNGRLCFRHNQEFFLLDKDRKMRYLTESIYDISFSEDRILVAKDEGVFEYKSGKIYKVIDDPYIHQIVFTNNQLFTYKMDAWGFFHRSFKTYNSKYELIDHKDIPMGFLQDLGFWGDSLYYSLNNGSNNLLYIFDTDYRKIEAYNIGEYSYTPFICSNDKYLFFTAWNNENSENYLYSLDNINFEIKRLAETTDIISTIMCDNDMLHVSYKSGVYEKYDMNGALQYSKNINYPLYKIFKYYDNNHFLALYYKDEYLYHSLYKNPEDIYFKDSLVSFDTNNIDHFIKYIKHLNIFLSNGKKYYYIAPLKVDKDQYEDEFQNIFFHHSLSAYGTNLKEIENGFTVLVDDGIISNIHLGNDYDWNREQIKDNTDGFYYFYGDSLQKLHFPRSRYLDVSPDQTKIIYNLKNSVVIEDLPKIVGIEEVNEIIKDNSKRSFIGKVVIPKGTEEIRKIKIYDLHGNEIEELLFHESKNSIFIETLKPGRYYYIIETKNSKTIKDVFIKE